MSKAPPLTASMIEALDAVESRRVYRLVDGGTRRLLQLPLAGRVLRRLAG